MSSFLDKKIKSYKKKKELSEKKKRTDQFIQIFESVSKELNLYERSRSELTRIINFMGTAKTSSDVFIKMVLIVHSIGGIGLSTLRRLSNEKIESLKSFELQSINDLLSISFNPVSEMLEEAEESVLEEPLKMYSSIRSYISFLYVHKPRTNLSYHERLGKDYELEPSLAFSVNRIASEGKESNKKIDLLEKFK